MSSVTQIARTDNDAQIRSLRRICEQAIEELEAIEDTDLQLELWKDLDGALSDILLDRRMMVRMSLERRRARAVRVVRDPRRPMPPRPDDDGDRYYSGFALRDADGSIRIED